MDDLNAKKDEILGQLKNFNVNKVHCYDPNEEFKLKQIMYDIGIKKLNECMKLVAPTLERKMKDNIFRKEAIVKLRAYIESLATLPLYPLGGAWHDDDAATAASAGFA